MPPSPSGAQAYEGIGGEAPQAMAGTRPQAADRVRPGPAREPVCPPAGAQGRRILGLVQDPRRAFAQGRLQSMGSRSELTTERIMRRRAWV